MKKVLIIILYISTKLVGMEDPYEERNRIQYTIENILETHQDVNQPIAPYGLSALCLAAEYDELEPLIIRLLRNHARLDTKTEHGNTALHISIINRAHANTRRIIYWALQNKISLASLINAPNHDGETPFFLACAQDTFHELIKLMLDHGADIITTTKDHRSVFYNALDAPFICKLLLDKAQQEGIYIAHLLDTTPFDFEPDTYEMVYLPEKFGSSHLMQRMIDCGAKLHIAGSAEHHGSRLHFAIQRGSFSNAMALLKAGDTAGATPFWINSLDKEGRTPLYMAVNHTSDSLLSDYPNNRHTKNIELIHMLLNRGADPNVIPYRNDSIINTALWLFFARARSAKKSNKTLRREMLFHRMRIKLLLMHGANPEQCVIKTKDTMFSEFFENLWLTPSSEQPTAAWQKKYLTPIYIQYAAIKERIKIAERLKQDSRSYLSCLPHELITSMTPFIRSDIYYDKDYQQSVILTEKT